MYPLFIWFVFYSSAIQGEEGMLEVDDNREFVKIRYDGSKITQAQNSQKIPRIFMEVIWI